MPNPRGALFAALFLGALAPADAGAQALVDTLFSWQGYGRPATCRVRVYAAPTEEDRAYAVVLEELASNHGPSTLSDVKLVAELVGRRFGIDPTGAFWVLHWGAFSFEGADPATGKELFLRATFRRTKSGLGSPSWRVLTREEVEALTDRQFR